MKIIFLCGSLEPGKDGVGDYTRRLASELIRKGNDVGAIGLRDRYASKVVDDFQISEGIQFPVLRLPLFISTSQRYNLAKLWINNFRPDWLSLQFVIFSFHAKGLPFGLSKDLAGLNEIGCKWNIMFHELWLGLNAKASKKLVLWGLVQKMLIKEVINTLKPTLIHTQSMVYIVLLKKLKQRPEHLPLFGNIPVIGNSLTNSNDHNEINLILFGTIHPDAQAEQPAKDVALYSQKHGVAVNLIFLGRCGAEQERWATIWRSEGLGVIELGEQSAEKISEVLSAASHGITTCNLSLIEKSGTVAAMREHGLPILCVADKWTTKDFDKVTAESGIYEYQEGDVETFFSYKKSGAPVKNTLKNVADKFITDLSKYD